MALRSRIETVGHNLKERKNQYAAGMTLAAVALAGCTADRAGHQLYWAPPVKAAAGQPVTAVVFGDSISNRTKSRGDYVSIMQGRGIKVILIDAHEGEQMVGGGAPSELELLTGSTPEDKRAQAAVKQADMIVEEFGTNPRVQHVDPHDFGNQILTIQKAYYRLNPHARRFVSDVATSNTSLMTEFSMRNTEIYESAKNPTYGYYTIPRCANLYPGCDPEHLSPWLYNASIAADTEGQVHETTTAGWQKEAAIVANTLRDAQNPSMIWVAPQYQGNGLG